MQVKLTVSDAAKNHIKKMLEKNQGGIFRLSIKKTGCSGYAYLPVILPMAEAKDLEIAVANDLSVFVDTTWQSLLDGVQIDYLEDEKTGLKQKRLVFSNVKEEGRCGCGESFHLRGGVNVS